MVTPLPQRVPENAPGDFYVARDVCTRCCVPHGEAPELLNDTEVPFRECYFRRQPRNEIEVEQAIRAISVSCVRALRYGGNDPKILARLQELDGPDACDAVETPQDEKPPRQWLRWWRRLFGAAGETGIRSGAGRAEARHLNSEDRHGRPVPGSGWLSGILVRQRPARKLVVLRDLPGALARVETRFRAPGREVGVAVDALQLAPLRRIVSILQRDLQMFRIEKHFPFPRLSFALHPLPSALLLKTPVDQRSDVLPAAPMVELERVHDALKAQPDDVRIESSRKMS